MTGALLVQIQVFEYFPLKYELNLLKFKYLRGATAPTQLYIGPPLVNLEYEELVAVVELMLTKHEVELGGALSLALQSEET